MSRFYRLFHVETPFDSTNRFQTSCVLSPLVLAIVRLIICVHIFATLVYKLVHDGLEASHVDIERHWSYFTNISYWSLGFYFLFAGFHGVVYSRTGTAPLQRWPRLLQLMHGLLYTTITIYPIIVTVVFWVILAPDASPFTSTFGSWSNISMHAMNSLWALFELLVPRTAPPPWMHLPPCVFFLVAYLGVAYVTFETQGFYTYGFLDPENGTGMLIAYIFGIFAAVVVLFAATWGVIWVREWAAAKMGLQGKTAGFMGRKRSNDEV